jgi:hypothetical protein
VNEVNADTVKVGDIVYWNPDKSARHYEEYPGPLKVVGVRDGGQYIVVERLDSSYYAGGEYYSWRFLTKPYKYDELLDGG